MTSQSVIYYTTFVNSQLVDYCLPVKQLYCKNCGFKGIYKSFVGCSKCNTCGEMCESKPIRYVYKNNQLYQEQEHNKELRLSAIKNMTVLKYKPVDDLKYNYIEKRNGMIKHLTEIITPRNGTMFYINPNDDSIVIVKDKKDKKIKKDKKEKQVKTEKTEQKEEIDEKGKKKENIKTEKKEQKEQKSPEYRMMEKEFKKYRGLIINGNIINKFLASPACDSNYDDVKIICKKLNDNYAFSNIHILEELLKSTVSGFAEMDFKEYDDTEDEDSEFAPYINYAYELVIKYVGVAKYYDDIIESYKKNPAIFEKMVKNNEFSLKGKIMFDKNDIIEYDNENSLGEKPTYIMKFNYLAGFAKKILIKYL